MAFIAGRPAVRAVQRGTIAAVCTRGADCSGIDGVGGRDGKLGAGGRCGGLVSTRAARAARGSAMGATGGTETAVDDWWRREGRGEERQDGWPGAPTGGRGTVSGAG